MRLSNLIPREFDSEINRNALVVLFGQTGGLLIGVFSSALLARGLGPERMGIFAVIAAGASIVLTFADMGLANSAVSQIAGNLRNRPAFARSTAKAYAILKISAGVLALLLVSVFSSQLRDALRLPRGQGTALVLLMGGIVFATGLNGLLLTLQRSLQNFGSMNLVHLLTAGLRLAMFGSLFLFGALNLYPALAVGIAAALGGAVVGYKRLPRPWRKVLWSHGSEVRQAGHVLFTFSKWLWISAVLSVGVAQLDLLLLNRLTTPENAGFYAIALNLSLKANIVNQALHTVLLPAVSAFSERRQYTRFIKQSFLRSLIAALLLILVLPLARPFIVSLYGVEYVPSVGIFFSLMSVILLDLLTIPFLLLAFPLQLPRLMVASDVLRILVLVALGISWIPVWGVYGAVLAKLIAKLCGALLLGAGILIRMPRTSLESET